MCILIYTLSRGLKCDGMRICKCAPARPGIIMDTPSPSTVCELVGVEIKKICVNWLTLLSLWTHSGNTYSTGFWWPISVQRQPAENHHQTKNGVSGKPDKQVSWQYDIMYQKHTSAKTWFRISTKQRTVDFWKEVFVNIIRMFLYPKNHLKCKLTCVNLSQSRHFPLPILYINNTWKYHPTPIQSVHIEWLWGIFNKPHRKCYIDHWKTKSQNNI